MWEQNQPIALLSIHAPTRGATGGDKVNLLTQIFQSTLLQEERQRIDCIFCSCCYFQSTLLQEERRKYC